MEGRGFHGGELEVQRRVGVRDVADRVGKSILAGVPEPARRFLGERRLVVIGGLDDHRRPWASFLAGPPGFVSVPDPETIRIADRPAAGEPLRKALRAGRRVGMIAIDFETRHRLRVNGVVTGFGEEGASLRAAQVYANCPKYIQVRSPEPGGEGGRRPRRVERLSGLTGSVRARIQRADTFFIATANPGEGADTSHRGGSPGFVEVEGDRIAWPDYRGNSMFNTLGNLEIHPRAGLLFPDFESGSALAMTGSASVDWNPDRIAAIPGAERLVIVRVAEILEIRNALPAPMELREYSPFNPPVRSGAEGPTG